MKKICEHCIHNACSYKTRGLENKCEKVQDYEQGYETGVADMRIENEKAIEAAVRLERKRIIKKACRLLEINKDHPFIGCEDPCISGYLTEDFIGWFRKAMEEEE